MRKFIENGLSIILLLCISAVPHFALAQKSNGNFGGVQVRTLGYGVQYQRTLAPVNSEIRQLFVLDGLIHKHPKEHRIYNPEIQNSGVYVYGKLNRVGLLRLNYGFKKSLIERFEWNKIGVSWNTTVGPQIVGLKPVYLNIYNPGPNSQPGTVTSERYDPDIHTTQSNIVGYASGRFGWDELAFTYGCQITSSIQLDWGSIGTGIKALNIGASLDFYPSGLEIMALTNNPKLYGTLFVSFLWGKEGE